MPRSETLDRMKELSRQLMLLANESNGNADLFDAILRADSALFDAIKGVRK